MLHPLNIRQKEELYTWLSQFVTPARKQRIEEISLQRTRHITLVLEDIFQAHNASAVLRSCDCFGIQDVHIIENQNRYQVNPDVALGASGWLSLYTYNRKENNTSECIASLRKTGYRIVATSPRKDDVLIDELPIDQPFALLFGTELTGLSREALESADAFVKIPMYGFTESFNISVSAALCMANTVERLRKSGICWQLSDSELLDLRLEWVCNTLRDPEAYIRDFLQRSKE